MHICDYEIPGLPMLLEAHIVPDLTVASHIGIHVLCKAGCVEIFTDKMCSVMYGGKVILRGYKDPSTDLWISPITSDNVRQQGKLQTSPGSDYVANATESTQSQAGPCMTHALQFPMPSNEIVNTHLARDSKIHPLRAHARQCHKFCAPIIMLS